MPDLNPKQAVGVMLAVILVMVTFLVGSSILGSVASVGSETSGGGEQARTASPLVDLGSAVEFQDTSYFAGEVLGITSVTDSTGQAIRLHGRPDSTYQSDSAIQFATDRNWTVGVHAEFNGSYGTTNGTVYSLNGRVLLQYDTSSQQWSAWYYDEATRSSHVVNVSATRQPGALQPVHVVANGSHLAIYRNNTRGEVADLSVDRSQNPLLNASNWAGRQDELTGYDTALNASQRQAAINDPVLPLSSVSPSFRVMFDEQSPSFPVYFTGASISVSNASFVSGLSGTVLSEGSDYAADVADGTITALDGGRLDGAPTVFVNYQFKPNAAVSGLTDDISGSLELFAVVPIALIGLLVFGALNRMQS
jgi:hypothetical protein